MFFTTTAAVAKDCSGKKGSDEYKGSVCLKQEDKHGQDIILHSLLSASSKLKTSVGVLVNRVIQGPQLSLSILTNMCLFLFLKHTLPWTSCNLRIAFSRSLL